MIKILYTCIALLFIVSPVMAGIYGTLWFIRRKEIRKLRKSIEDLSIENRKLLYGEFPGAGIPQETSRDIEYVADTVSAGQSDVGMTTTAPHKRKKRRTNYRDNRSGSSGSSGIKVAKA